MASVELGAGRRLPESTQPRASQQPPACDPALPGPLVLHTCTYPPLQRGPPPACLPCFKLPCSPPPPSAPRSRCAAWVTLAWWTRQASPSRWSLWTTPSPSSSCRVGGATRVCAATGWAGMAGTGCHWAGSHVPSWWVAAAFKSLWHGMACKDSWPAGSVAAPASNGARSPAGIAVGSCSSRPSLIGISLCPSTWLFRRGVPQGGSHQQGDRPALRALWPPRVLLPGPLRQEGGAGASPIQAGRGWCSTQAVAGGR